MCRLLAIFVFLLIVQIMVAKKLHFQPEQVHLSFGESPREIVVTWTTFVKTDSLVDFGIEKLNSQQEGKPYKFKSRYIHRVSLSHLIPDTRYAYRCGSDKAWSQQFHFHTPAVDSDDWVLSLAIYGDLGINVAYTLPLLTNDTHKQMYDAIFHIGDIAYNLDSRNGRWGDKFLRKIEQVAAYVPYMTCAGNHESNRNFSDYRKRFNMPGDTGGLYYSFDFGPVHFIVLHTEFYYYLNEHYDARHARYQYQWLERDLQKATKPENRAKRPWIITLGHRPMYCSVDPENDCRPEFVSLLRKGIPVHNIYGLEDILYRHSVDVEIWGHQHAYERSWPLYDSKVFNGSLEEPYRNSKAPVHITSGAAGSFGGTDKFSKPKPVWAAFQASDWSFTRMKAYNATHLYFEQITRYNVTSDSFWIIKDKHGADA